MDLKLVRATTVTSFFSETRYSCSMAGTEGVTRRTAIHYPGLLDIVNGQYSKSGDRTDMQLDEGFWMRWSDDCGATFQGGRVVVPVRRSR